MLLTQETCNITFSVQIDNISVVTYEMSFISMYDSLDKFSQLDSTSQEVKSDGL